MSTKYSRNYPNTERILHREDLTGGVAGKERNSFFRTFRERGEFARSGGVEEKFFAISSDVTGRQARLGLGLGEININICITLNFPPDSPIFFLQQKGILLIFSVSGFTTTERNKK